MPSVSSPFGRGTFVPPVTGNYTFWIASDDESELWLSTDETRATRVSRSTWLFLFGFWLTSIIAPSSLSFALPHTKSTPSICSKIPQRKIAEVPWAVLWAEWDRRPGQESAPIFLEAGRRYLMEALGQENDGDDFMTVAVQIPANASAPCKHLPICNQTHRPRYVFALLTTALIQTNVRLAVCIELPFPLSNILISWADGLAATVKMSCR